MALKTSTFFDLKTCLRSKAPHSHSTKGPLLDALERLYGPRHLSTSTTRNRCFFLLEHLEASWMKHFVSSLLTLFVPTSLLWLHDGIWVAPVPSRAFIDTANRLATAALGISSLPLQLSCTSLTPKYKEVYKDIINASLPPSHDSPPHFVPPLRLLCPPLSELEARTAFIRMMARQLRFLRLCLWPASGGSSLRALLGHSSCFGFCWTCVREFFRLGSGDLSDFASSRLLQHHTVSYCLYVVFLRFRSILATAAQLVERACPCRFALPMFHCYSGFYWLCEFSFLSGDLVSNSIFGWTWGRQFAFMCTFPVVLFYPVANHRLLFLD